jgi:Methyltransferase domain
VISLNLGSGANCPTALNVVTLDHTGWKHIDICPLYHTTECYDITQGIREDDNSIETVYMGDFFEHLLRIKATFVLQECFRVLQPGGKILISVPDMLTVMLLWLNGGGVAMGHNDFDRCSQLIWGEQDEQVKSGNTIPDSHFAGYTLISLTNILAQTGFVRIERTYINGCWYELAMIAYKPI